MKANSDSSKQNIKRDRIKSYFLDAAVSIITHDGYGQVSVRKVADIAGYSYATIYNYFSSLNELLWDARAAMINDLQVYMMQNMPAAVRNIADLSHVFSLFIDYHITHPNTFAFFYFCPLTQPESRKGEPGLDFEAMWQQTFKCFVENGALNETDINTVAKALTCSVCGMLTLHFSGNGFETAQQIKSDLDSILEYMLSPGRLK